MFLKFKSDKEREEYGGTDFVEIQYCSLPNNMPNETKVYSIHFWDYSSLYVSGDDLNEFYEEYKEIIGNGLYANQKEGLIDCYGINYYNPEKAEMIKERLQTSKPKEYEIFLEWLNQNPYNNGFYILGE